MELQLIIEKIDKLGLKKKHIANQIGCSQVELSYFLNNKRKLRPECYTRLVKYLS